jgi:hypothetical protein
VRSPAVASPSYMLLLYSKTCSIASISQQNKEILPDPALDRQPNPMKLHHISPPASGGFLTASPGAGVKAGRRPPAGPGLDAGEDGATLSSRKRAVI